MLKKYGDHKYKLTLHNCLRVKGVEADLAYTAKCTVNDLKLADNIARARAKIFEYAYCNEWEYFINLTLNKAKYNRYELKPYIKALSQWLRDYSKRHKTQIKYLFIPEHHKDGAWHIHGLIKGIPKDELSEFIAGKHPQHLIDDGYLNWQPYFEKFGFVTVGAIKNHEACSKYITKYVTKDMASNNTALGAHLYYCSQGLKSAVEIERGLLKSEFSSPDYENEYVHVKWLKNIDDAQAYFYKPILSCV